jgi:hypothetical protein
MLTRELKDFLEKNGVGYPSGVSRNPGKRWMRDQVPHEKRIRVNIAKYREPFNHFLDKFFRKEDLMSSNAYPSVKEWLAKNQRQMIVCPNQPGNLMISEKSCGKRYQASMAPQQKFYTEDFFSYTFQRGLSVCRDCKIGKKVAKTQRPTGTLSMGS